MKQIRLVLVDDHEILMDGMAALLNGIPGIQVIAKCATVNDALYNIDLLKPQLVITDISMGESGGLQLLNEMRTRFPLVRAIVLSMHHTAAYIQTMIEAGASGYLLKNVRESELVKAIETVMAGQEYIQQELVGKYSKEPPENSRTNLLSAREIEIIRLISQEFSTAEIAARLFLSQFTVETHRKNILRKTNSKSVVGLLNYAREQKLL